MTTSKMSKQVKWEIAAVVAVVTLLGLGEGIRLWACATCGENDSECSACTLAAALFNPPGQAGVQDYTIDDPTGKLAPLHVKWFTPEASPGGESTVGSYRVVVEITGGGLKGTKRFCFYRPDSGTDSYHSGDYTGKGGTVNVTHSGAGYKFFFTNILGNTVGQDETGALFGTVGGVPWTQSASGEVSIGGVVESQIDIPAANTKRVVRRATAAMIGASTNDVPHTDIHSTSSGPDVVRKRVTDTDFNSDGSRRLLTTIHVFFPGSTNYGKLKFTVDPEGVKRYLTTNGGANLAQGVDPADPTAACGLDDPGTVSDGALQAYASVVYDGYDANGRPGTMTVGCSSCGGGAQGTYTYAYGTTNSATNLNMWASYRRTTDPQGLRTVEFLNTNNEMLYHVEQLANDTNKCWITHYVLDSYERIVEVREPAACQAAGYGLAVAGGWPVNVTPSDSGTDGVVRLSVFDSNGLLTAEKIRQGTTNDASKTYWQRKYVYGASGITTFNSNTVYRVTQEISYPSQTTNESATDAVTVSHDYRFYTTNNTNTHTIEFHKITQPVTFTTNNGSGAASWMVYHYYSTNDTNYQDYHQDWTARFTKWDGGNSSNVLASLSYAQWSNLYHQATDTYSDARTSDSGHLWTGTSYSDTIQAPLDPWTTNRWASSSNAVGLKTSYGIDDYGRTILVTDAATGLRAATSYTMLSTNASGKATTTALVTLTVPHVDATNNTNNYVPMSLQVTDLAGRTLTSAAGLPTTAINGTNLYLSWSTNGATVDSAFVGTLTSRTESFYDPTQGWLTGTAVWANATNGSADKYWTTNTYCTTNDTNTNQVFGRLLTSAGPDGTITKTLYDQLGRPIETQMGTSSSNLSPVSRTYYDSGTNTLGNVDNAALGLVTRSVSFFGSNTNTDFYASLSHYDWQGRMDQSMGPDHLIRKNSVQPDAAGMVTNEVYYDANTNFVADSGELRSRTVSSLDPLGRTYQTIAYEVDASGTVGHGMTSLTWYDGEGRVIKTKNPNGLFHKTTYDSLGRAAAQYVSYQSDEADTDYTAAFNVTGDTVIEQSATAYDDTPAPGLGGNAWLVTSYQRNDNVSDTNTLTSSNSRVKYAVTWFDSPLHRPQKSVFYGSNNGAGITSTNDTNFGGGQTYSAGGPAVNSSTNYVVTTTEYDNQGRAFKTIDNAARETRTLWLWDTNGHRVVQTIENYSGSGTPGTDFNRVTEQVYDGAGRLWKLTAKNAKGNGMAVEDQTTWYFYGSTNSGGLQTDVVYPDAAGTDVSGGALTTNGTNHVHTDFDLLGRATKLTDQNGTVHTYSFTAEGRLSADTVTVLGSGVDGGILRIGRGYDSLGLGRLTTVTSYSDSNGTNAVNEVKFTFSDSTTGTWGSLTKFEQNVTNSVGSGTPAINFTYDDGAGGGTTAQYLRLASVTYPGPGTPTAIYYNYTNAGPGFMLSRLDNLTLSATNGTNLASYRYFGAGSLYQTLRRSVSNLGSAGLSLTYAYTNSTNNLDCLGRVIDQTWTLNSTNSVDRYQYSYTNSGSRTSRINALNTNLSEVYTFDGLDRLTLSNRGVLATPGGAIADKDAKHQQAWMRIDSLGNWQTFRNDAIPGDANLDGVVDGLDANLWTTNFTGGRAAAPPLPWTSGDWNQDGAIDGTDIAIWAVNSGGPGISPTNSVVLNATNDAANKITGLATFANTNYNAGGPWIVPAYDRNGNMTTGPSALTPSSTNTMTYDAWNRLVKVSTNGTTIAEYRYNGLNHRIRKYVNKTGSTGGWDVTDYYYNPGWQVLEERKTTGVTRTGTTELPGATAVYCQYVWDPRYIDAPVCRLRDPSLGSNLTETLYYCTDANMNVTALVDGPSGAVVERYAYDAYGKVTVLDTNWGTRSGSSYDNQVLYCGYRYDPESGLYHVRHRYLDPNLGKWVTWDRAGYTDGYSLYQYVRSNPSALMDSTGFASEAYYWWLVKRETAASWGISSAGDQYFSDLFDGRAGTPQQQKAFQRDVLWGLSQALRGLDPKSPNRNMKTDLLADLDTLYNRYDHYVFTSSFGLDYFLLGLTDSFKTHVKDVDKEWDRTGAGEHLGGHLKLQDFDVTGNWAAEGTFLHELVHVRNEQLGLLQGSKYDRDDEGSAYAAEYMVTKMHFFKDFEDTLTAGNCALAAKKWNIVWRTAIMNGVIGVGIMVNGVQPQGPAGYVQAKDVDFIYNRYWLHFSCSKYRTDLEAHAILGPIFKNCCVSNAMDCPRNLPASFR